jgi:stearoyl-CoA desaturase (delta-9 desaturase)
MRQLSSELHSPMSKLRIPFERVNWVTSIFLIGTFLLSITVVPWYVVTFEQTWFQWAMFAFMVPATAMSITLGYHRLFSHLSFKAKWPVKLFTLIFGACAFENSCLDWSSDHRTHHKHVDHDEDPYDISKGFMWAHIGWLMFKLAPEHPATNVSDLRKEKLVMWQHKYVQWIAFLVGIVGPTILGGLYNQCFTDLPVWQGALGGFLIAGVLRVVVVQHSTFFINSLCHTIGKRPYSTKHSARDSIVMAFATFGEGYHNYHHEFQHDYRNGVKPWQWDPTKWTIWTLSKLGLASNLRRVPDSKILLAEMGEARMRAEEKLAALNAANPTMVDRAHIALNELCQNLAKNYAELEKAVSDRVEVSRQTLLAWQSETRELVRCARSIRLIQHA